VIKPSLSFDSSGESLLIAVLYAVMRRVDKYIQLALTVGAGLVATAVPPISLHDAFNSQQAYAYTAEIAGFGERWPGSPGHRKTENIIRQVLQKDGAQIESDDFVATTPRGPISVHNMIGKFNVSTNPKQRIFVLAGHYDTLFRPGFIGANDGASTWKKRSTISKATTVFTGVDI
jgi:hypothetical protein